ncbi:MAG: hypothetical protein ACK4L7_11485, partial [Flavobacteriales bacterium]
EADTINRVLSVERRARARARGAARRRGGDLSGRNGQLLAKAELAIPVGEAFYPYHPPPAQLVPLRRNATGAEAFLPDQLSGGLGLGGDYDTAAKAYVFNITRFAQGVIKGTFAPRMELLPGSGGVTANRVVLNGPAAQDPMLLRLTFTSY